MSNIIAYQKKVHENRILHKLYLRKNSNFEKQLLIFKVLYFAL